jgi:hypothetical protein
VNKVKKLILALALILSAGSGAVVDAEHDWFGEIPICC